MCMAGSAGAAFSTGAQKFAAGGVTAAALFEMLRPNYAWAVQVPPDDPRIVARRVSVPSPKGNGTIAGYLVRPATKDRLPAVIVIHENRGFNPYIEDVARRLALANFIAFAPDGLTSVGGYPGDDEKGLALFKTVDPAKMQADFLAAAEWLKAQPDCTGKLGAIGFCFGGGVVNSARRRHGVGPLRRGPVLRRPAARGGRRQDQGADQRAIRRTRHAHHSGWPAFDAALTAAGVPHEGHIYKGANHGFHNDTTPRYDEAAAKEAWGRAIDWLNRYLRG